MSTLSVFQVSGSAMQAESERMNVAASNLANANSVQGPDGKPYRAREVVFRALGPSGLNGVEVSRVVNSTAPMKREYRPGAPGADAQGYVEMPNVSPVAEMVNMIEASRAYQADVNVMTTGEQIAEKTLAVGGNL